MNANRPKRSYQRRAPIEARRASEGGIGLADAAVAVMDEAVTPRPEMRADPRPAMREESSRDRAARRAAEILGHLPDENEAHDTFDVSELQPDGFRYQWKMRTILGQEFPQRQLEQAKHGWEPVPASRHPQLMPHGWKGSDIEREGLVLMERPAVIQEEMERRERKDARDLVQGNREKLGEANAGEFSRDRNVTLKKSYSPVDIPGDAG